MSTGLNCRIYEKTAGKWYYDLETYSHRDEYDTEGPFPTFKAATDHLHRNHSNPGGYSVQALPGCKHDLLKKAEFRLPNEAVTHTCDRCGAHLDMRTSEEKVKEQHARNWKDNHIQFPRLLAEIYAAGLSAKQEKDICTSMDITRDELYELLERSDKEFERLKPR